MVRIEKMVALYSQSIDRPPFLSFFLFLLFSSFFFLPLSRDRVRTVYFSRAPIGISAVPNDSAPSSDEHAHFRRCIRNYGGAISNGRRGACDTQPTTGFRNSRGRLIWKSGRFANRSFQEYLLPLLSTDSMNGGSSKDSKIVEERNDFVSRDQIIIHENL